MNEVKKCSICGGTGSIRKDEFTYKPCQCTQIRRSIAKLGPEIYCAPFIDETPFYVTTKTCGQPPILDKTRENLFIKITWSDLLPHLKRALGGRALDTDFNFYFTIVTDERLKNVFVGAEAYVARGRKKRDDMSTVNSLSDLIGADFHLVIIRLGFLGYKNQAMAGIIKEALMIRRAARLPTWVIDDFNPLKPFGPGHLAYSDDLSEYLRLNFETIDEDDIGGASAVAPAPARGGGFTTSSTGDVDLDDVFDTPAPPPVQTKPKPKPKPVVVEDDEDDDKPKGKSSSEMDGLSDTMLGLGPKKWKPAKKSGGWKGGNS